MWIGLALCALALVVLFLAEARQRAPIAAAAKVVASASFLLAALIEGAADTLGGQALLIALVWSALGDLLLIPRDNRVTFLFGMVAFAIAHVGYAFVFHLRGVDALGVGLGAAIAGAAGLAFFLWLRPHVRQRAPGMIAPVLGYLAVITLMVSMGAGAFARAPDAAWLGLVAAVVFWLSDVTVAMVRFAGGRRLWRLVGLPLYYAAQFLFVATLR
ncbi:MAG: lysoplasmalogenase [Deltaproteobacteria bacterium]|nr:lysoplasmalogenase [Deltaproteobacteria bacterium]